MADLCSGARIRRVLVVGMCCLASLARADSWPDPAGAPVVGAAASVGAAVRTDDRDLADQFPALRAMRRAPYRVMTDLPAATVEPALLALDDLRRQFAVVFGELIVDPRPLSEIEVVYFRYAADYRRYTRQQAPALESSAGYYAAHHDRLILVSQPARNEPGHPRGALPASPLGSPAAPINRSLASWSAMASPASTTLAERVIRHEGAHQLFCHYGIHSQFALEPTWITEGLAEYCVPAKIGARHAGHWPRLREWARNDRLLSLGVLLNHRDPVGFFALDPRRAELAYAQSWALVYYLMESRHRAGFLELLRVYRDTPRATARLVEDAEPRQLLLQALGTSQAALEAEWQAWLTSR